MVKEKSFDWHISALLLGVLGARAVPSPTHTPAISNDGLEDHCPNTSNRRVIAKNPDGPYNCATGSAKNTTNSVEARCGKHASSQ